MLRFVLVKPTMFSCRLAPVSLLLGYNGEFSPVVLSQDPCKSYVIKLIKSRYLQGQYESTVQYSTVYGTVRYSRRMKRTTGCNITESNITGWTLKR